MPPLLDWCWTHVRVGLYPFAALSLPTSGLAWRGRRRGAQLDGEFAFYASRRRLRAWPGGGGAHSWTEIFLPTPLAADLRGSGLPGAKAAAEGRAAGQGIRFLRLSPPTSGLARMGRRGGRAAGRGVCFSTLLAAIFGHSLDGAMEGCSALALSFPFYLSLTGLSMGGQAMLGHWSQHHLRL